MMKKRYRFTVGIVGVLLALLIVLKGQGAFGFGVNGNKNGDPTKLTYTCNAQRYSVKLKPIEMLEPRDSLLLQSGLGDELLEATGRTFLPGRFEFTPATRPLEANFTIRNYQAATNFYPAGHCLNPYKDRAGANIDITYTPEGSDPTSHLHWIQIVTDTAKNYGLPPGEILPDRTPHPPGEPFLDIGVFGVGVITDPYYPGFELSHDNTLGAGDTPRQPATRTHTWTAELYLVQEGSDRKVVTIYNGIRWGYTVEMASASALQPGFKLVALNGDLVDGHKISSALEGQIDNKGNVVYLAEIEQGRKALVLNDKIVYYSGQTVGNITVNIGDFFLFRDGSLDVLLYTENGPVITRNAAEIFDARNISSFKSSNQRFTKYTNSANLVGYSDNQHSYYYGYYDDKGYHILKNGSEEVSSLPTFPAKADCNNGEGITRIINNRHQSVCIGRMTTTSQAILVRDDGKIFPSVGGPVAMNNNGTVLNYGKIFPLNSQQHIPFGIGLLDYTKDAFESNHTFTEQDYESHLLRIPYGRLVEGRLSDADQRNFLIGDVNLVIGDYSNLTSGPNLMGSDLTDNGNLLLLIGYGKEMIIKWIPNRGESSEDTVGEFGKCLSRAEDGEEQPSI